ncbi:hypothetical protein EBR21_05300, partial [bacterium]|nr:hypothetical protein [bacterium]
MLVGKFRKKIRVSARAIFLLELLAVGSLSPVPRASAQSSPAQNSAEQNPSIAAGESPAEQLKLQRRIRKLEELIEQENVFEAAELLKTFSEKVISQNKRLLVA